MRLKVYIEDIEYRDALIKTLSESEKNVYIELIDSIGQISFAYGTILLTDLSEEKVVRIAGEENAPGVVVLTSCITNSDNNGPSQCKVKRIFKYQNASSILSEIAELHYKLYGAMGSRLISTSKFLVCGDSTEQCSTFTDILARQVRFRHGGTIMILSLTYINSHPVSEEKDCSNFARMMYMRDVGRGHSQDLYTYTDSYGVTYMRLPVGNNPLAYVDVESLLSICSYLCDGNIETLILDIGSEFSVRNQKLFKAADEILIFNHGGRSTDWQTFPSMQPKEISKKVKEFTDIDTELNIDDFLREKYGVIIEDETTENDSKAIRRRDRQTRIRGKKVADSTE